MFVIESGMFSRGVALWYVGRFGFSGERGGGTALEGQDQEFYPEDRQLPFPPWYVCRIKTGLPEGSRVHLHVSYRLGM